MARQQSRTDRWMEAAGNARAAYDAIVESSELSTALDALREVQGEYEEWRDNLPENLQQSALGEKLEAVLDIELPEDISEYSLSDIEQAIDQAEGIDLPLGFGRD